jgi:hypothetical protein
MGDNAWFGNNFGGVSFAPSGFGESFLDQVRSGGILNSMFVEGITGSLPIGRTSSLPFWTISTTSGTGSASLTQGTFYPGGQYVACGFGGIGVTTTNAVWLTCDQFPVEPGGSIYLRYATEFNVAAGAVVVWPTIRFLRVDGSVIGLDHSGAMTTQTINTSLAYYGSTADAITVPVNARFATVTVKSYETTTHSASNEARICMVEVKPAAL